MMRKGVIPEALIADQDVIGFENEQLRVILLLQLLDPSTTVEVRYI